MSHPVDQGIRYDAAHARAYERKIRALIPGYETLHELSSFMLLDRLPADARVLVAGSGTGEELARYAQLAPGWRLTGVEPSAEMNACAVARIEEVGASDRVTLIQGKPGEVDLGGPYDAVTSLLVMHFLPDDGSKARYLAALGGALKPSGTLLLADLTGERGSPEFETLFKVWRSQQDATRNKAEAVALDFAHLATNVHPLSPQRRTTLFAEAGLVVEQAYWQSLGLLAVSATTA
ncbi:MAG: class I SAM-dependent methyltransferase [Burkholderiales bacterium]|nr:class I SAM-dependent methyltransferase [Burkholderiales bacterium]